MGSNMANDLATMEALDLIRMEQAMAMHLQGNHYPPVPSSMNAVCIRAVEEANKIQAEHPDAMDWFDELELPEGITFRGRNTAPIHNLIEDHRLWVFVDHSWDCDCHDCMAFDPDEDEA